MQKNKRTTISISQEKKLRLERMAIEASHATKTSITWTDIVNYLIDSYAKEACEDLKSKAKAANKVAANEKNEQQS
ncbi:hypothetical protein [Escherichia coli]|uniref:hypothetical protein n=1 Tax=Escherichia coli TaxID=562 RepID=UPI0011CCB2D5|nr:hypothetical protein [Escherichia coli]TXP98729.1 hypothetical protein FV290_24540 [Escherichia coli]